MPNLATVLKQEIGRLARKETRSALDSTKNLVSQHRRDIAALKRQVKELERKLAFLESKESKRLSRPTKPTDEAPNLRFSPKSVRAHRKRLGMSAADYAMLLGVSMQTVYHWEQGKARPRQSQLATLAAVRKLGKREGQRQLELLTKNGRAK